MPALSFASKCVRGILILCLSVSALQGYADTPGNISPKDLQAAIDRGIGYLRSQQQTNGSWAPENQPAITAMVLTACVGEPTDKLHAEQPEFLRKGYASLLTRVQPNGAIAHTNYQTYSTSHSLEALQANYRPEYEAVIKNGRAFLAQQQMGPKQVGEIDPKLIGGIGYGDGRLQANLANTMAALDALHITRPFGGGTEGMLIDQKAMVAFLNRCQHFSTINPEPWVNEDARNKGGFIYHPTKSFAGEVKLPTGQTSYVAYASMTYDGLLGYLHMGVNKKSPEVVAAFDWQRRNFSLDQNTGMGSEGLFYYYLRMAKALAAYGQDEFEVADGKKINWRTALGDKLISLQAKDGSWVNPTERWRENDPVLVTAYALQTLEVIAKGKR